MAAGPDSRKAVPFYGSMGDWWPPRFPVIGIDPGPKRSGVAVLRTGGTVEATDRGNGDLADWLWHAIGGLDDGVVIAIEQVVSYGAAVGNDTLETARWSGVFGGVAWSRGVQACMVSVPEYKHWLTGSRKSRTPQIRQSLIDAFGGRERAVTGAKCSGCGGKGWRGRGRPTCADCGGKGWLVPPGPLSGISGSHQWSAAAVAFWALIKGQGLMGE